MKDRNILEMNVVILPEIWSHLSTFIDSKIIVPKSALRSMVYAARTTRKDAIVFQYVLRST